MGAICGTAAFRNRHTRRGVSFSAQSFAVAQPVLGEWGTHCAQPRRVHVVVISAPVTWSEPTVQWCPAPSQERDLSAADFLADPWTLLLVFVAAVVVVFLLVMSRKQQQ